MYWRQPVLRIPFLIDRASNLDLVFKFTLNLCWRAPSAIAQKWHHQVPLLLNRWWSGFWLLTLTESSQWLITIPPFCGHFQIPFDIYQSSGWALCWMEWWWVAPHPWRWIPFLTPCWSDDFWILAFWCDPIGFPLSWLNVFSVCIGHQVPKTKDPHSYQEHGSLNPEET